MIWTYSHRCDTAPRIIADRHYNRQSVGAKNFVPPGRCIVLAHPRAVWVTSWPYEEFTKHAWAGAWVNSAFRREGNDSDPLASTMIRAAIAATRSVWGEVPRLGIITFVDASKVKRKRDVGRCYRKAGFEHVGHTKGGLWAFQMVPASMPLPVAGARAQLELGVG